MCKKTYRRRVSGVVSLKTSLQKKLRLDGFFFSFFNDDSPLGARAEIEMPIFRPGKKRRTLIKYEKPYLIRVKKYQESHRNKRRRVASFLSRYRVSHSASEIFFLGHAVSKMADVETKAITGSEKNVAKKKMKSFWNENLCRLRNTFTLQCIHGEVD